MRCWVNERGREWDGDDEYKKDIMWIKAGWMAALILLYNIYIDMRNAI
jgi:hypothetical protein